jgi:hypothetical protein
VTPKQNHHRHGHQCIAQRLLQDNCGQRYSSRASCSRSRSLRIGYKNDSSRTASDILPCFESQNVPGVYAVCSRLLVADGISPTVRWTSILTSSERYSVQNRFRRMTVTKMLSTAYPAIVPNRCKLDLATTSCVVSSEELRLTSSRLT